MDNIHFAIIKLTSKGCDYSESEYEIKEDRKGIKWIKGVHCWNGTCKLVFEGTQINFAWANEFPLGVIESKMWCDSDGLKTARDVLKKTLDEFLLNWKPYTPMDKKANKKQINTVWDMFVTELEKAD